MNTETSPLDHHARIVGTLERARDNAVQQAQIHAQEARTQRSIVMGILRELGLPEEDWNAERLVVEHIEQLEREREQLRTLLRELADWYSSTGCNGDHECDCPHRVRWNRVDDALSGGG